MAKSKVSKVQVSAVVVEVDADYHSTFSSLLGEAMSVARQALFDKRDLDVTIRGPKRGDPRGSASVSVRFPKSP